MALLALLLFSLAAGRLNATSSAESRQRIPGSLRSLSQENRAGVRVIRSQLTARESNAMMDFAVILRMRNLEELRARIDSGQAVPKDQMSERYLPLKADFDRVADWLVGQGLTVTLRDPAQTNLFVRGTVAQISRALQVDFVRVRTADGEFTSVISGADNGGPELPRSLAGPILAVDGLQPHVLMHVPRKSSPQAVASYQGYFTPADISAAYSVPAALNGSGQTIAIIMGAFPSGTDIGSFWQASGIASTATSFNKVSIFGGPTAASQSADVTEVTLDSEWSTAMAPGAQFKIYGIPTLSLSNLLAACTQILADAAADSTLRVVSYSGSGSENLISVGSLQAASQTLAQLAAAGITFLASSGDGGSNPNSGTAGNGYNPANPLTVGYPASDPYVTAVGGTTLSFNQAWVATAESAWTPGSLGTGGGVSGVFSRPSWQSRASLPSGLTRCVPDIAAVSNSNTPSTNNVGALIILNGSPTGEVGTSLSCPVWAGLTAVINQARANYGLKPLGLLGPWLYPLLGSSGFRDIVTGNNGAYSAGPGYDLCTGIGAPILSNLITLILEEVTSVGAPAGGVNAGSSVTMSVTAQLPGTYQWQLNGVNIPGATSAVYTIPVAGTTDAGVYTVVISYAAVAAPASYAMGQLTVTSDARIVNLSARANVGSGAALLDTGFVVSGSASASKQLLIRGIGPTLATFGVTGVLATPSLALTTAAGTPIASNAVWGGSPVLASAMAGAGAFTLATNSLDSVVLKSVAPGAYTAALVGSTAGATGVALNEIYDTSYQTDGSRLINISARANVGTGANALIAGFVVGSGASGASETVLVRAAGPALTGLGVAGALPNPVLTIYDAQSNVMASNVGWGSASTRGTSKLSFGVEAANSATFARTGAFAWSQGSADSALVITLPPGAYTAQVTGGNGATGVSLAEIYEVR